MALTRTTVSGNIVLPDDTSVEGMIVEFVLSAAQADSPEVMLQDPVEVELADNTGAFSVALWPNSLGTGSLYRVYVVNPNLEAPYRVDGRYERRFLGTIAVPNTGTANFADIISLGTVPDSGQQDALAQALGAQAAAQAAQAAAEAAQALSEGAAATAGIGTSIGFGSVALLKSDTTMGYSGGATNTVSSGSVILAGGYRYQVVASGATDHHIENSNGVKLKVVGSPGKFTNVHAFGTTGNAADDQTAALLAAAASKLPVYLPPAAVFKTSQPLVISAPWKGFSKGQGNPGSTTDTSTALIETSEIRFTGTGWCVTTRAPFSDIALRGTVGTAGQSGIRATGAAIAQELGPVRVMEFDEIGIELGDATPGSELGVFFSTMKALEVNNRARMGEIGVHIQGGGASSTNANIFSGIFAVGAWEKYVVIGGHNNTIFNCDVNPEPSLVAGLGGTIVAGVEITGDGNTLVNPYFEPTIGQADDYDTLISFSAAASSNDVIKAYSPSGGNKIDGKIEDLGTANCVTFADIGSNFTPSRGVSYSETNLLFNTALNSVDPSTLPDGWVLGGGSTGTVDMSTVQLRGSEQSFRIVTAGTRAQVVSHLLSSSPLAVRNLPYYLPPGMLRGQTLTVGCWVWSDTAGVGSVKVTVGASTLGAAEHSGSGKWEFLVARGRVEDAATEVAIALRNNSSFTTNTGTCYFSEPIAVLGKDVTRHPTRKPLDSFAPYVTGRMVHREQLTLTPDSATPSVKEGNVFRTANTAATTITNFLDPPSMGSQEILVVCRDSFTSVANNGNIRTTTNTTVALTNNKPYRFTWVGDKWWML